MPRCSRHKSHKQSKHSSKAYYSDSEEDVKMKEKEKYSSKDEGGDVRVLKDSSHSAQAEKRKLSSSSHLKKGKDGKDVSGHGNGDASEDYLSSKRRKDRVEGGSDRWNSGGDEKGDIGSLDKEMRGEILRIDSEKGHKSRESKCSGDSKSKSSKTHEIGVKGEKNASPPLEKEDDRSVNSRGESKRKSAKESGRKEGKESREVKEKERVSDGNRKILESKRDGGVPSADGDVAKRPGSQLEEASEDRKSKRGRENTELTLQEELQNPESQKELDKRMRRRREGSTDRDRYPDAREIDSKHNVSRGDRVKDAKYKEERYKDGSHGVKYHENIEKDDRHRDERYREDAEKGVKPRDDKYGEDADRDSRRGDEKYRDDSERENKRKDDKYHEEGDREDRRRDDKCREDGEGDGQRRFDKHREDSERESRHRDHKYREDSDKDNRRDERYCDDGERDDRHRDDRYKDDGDRHREEKRREDYESRHWDVKQGDDLDKEKRLKESKYKDEHSSRNRSGDKYDAKYLREDNYASEIQRARKMSVHESSPTYDNWARMKDDQGRKRTSDKEEHNEIRPRSTKDQRYDTEKRSVNLVSDIGRSTSRTADLELTPNRNRRQISPSSNSHYRVSKQDESKYREYLYEDRVKHSVLSSREYPSAAGVNDKGVSCRSMEKVVQKDNCHLGDLSAERRLKLDTRTSPRQLVDKSPSTTSTELRHFSRSDLRRSFDVEDSGQRTGGPKDAKDYSGREGRGGREMGSEALVGDDLSLGVGDTLSVSSPFARTGHLSSSSKSLLPPPFRVGVDSSLPFGSAEDDSMMKFNNRHRRIGDPNMVRVQGSPWKNVPSWPSPVANGFMPFQHAPPPVGFHPVMQQFPPPPIFGVRPPMELNHPGMPYHIPDADRFTGHVRPIGWLNPMDESCPPLMQGWDANNSAFNEESHFFGRPDWDHGRNLSSGRGWDTSGDMWRGPKIDACLELQPSSDKERHLTDSVDVASTDISVTLSTTEQVEHDTLAESIKTNHSSDTLEKNTPDNSKAIPWENINTSKMSQKDDVQLCHVYLSMLDISADLTDPELYRKCSALIDADGTRISEVENSEIFCVEDMSEANEETSSKHSNASFFSTINDSLCERAMMLYKNQRENFRMTGADNASFSRVQTMSSLKSAMMKQSSEDLNAGELVSDDVEVQPEDKYTDCNEDTKISASLQKLGDIPYDTCEEFNEPITCEQSEEATISVRLKDEMQTDPEVQLRVLENSVPTGDEESSGSYLPTKVEEDILPTNSRSNELATRNEEEMFADAKYGSLLLSNVNASSKACEVMMQESIESVNLSRIHHSPGSTH